jgi:hypothetical protein
MARRDFYFREDDPGAKTERWLFAWNFLKGTFGIWCRLCLIIGLAVTCSTYLSGVISLLVVGFLYLGGTFRDFLLSVVEGKNFGGGPLESAMRLFNPAVAAQGLELSGAHRGVALFDDTFRTAFRFIFFLIPDVDRFDQRPYVASGFDIPLGQMLFSPEGCLVPLIAYLIPWMILTFYMIRSREIAGAT